MSKTPKKTPEKKTRKTVRRKVRKTAGKNAHVLYILMRNDMASMNPGKACAHAGHAANAFTHHWQTMPAAVRRQWTPAVRAWMASTKQGFGNTVTKAGPIGEIRKAVAEVRRLKYMAGIVHDPEYPLLDGEVMHLIPLDTCAFVFGPREGLRGCGVFAGLPRMN